MIDADGVWRQESDVHSKLAHSPPNAKRQSGRYHRFLTEPFGSVLNVLIENSI
jgi:hypothetical protein